MAVITPRIRGRAVRKGAGWGWELFVTIGPDSGPDAIEPICVSANRTFLNEMAAQNDLRLHAKDLMELACETLGMPKPDAMLDLIRNEFIDSAEFAKPKKPEGAI